MSGDSPAHGDARLRLDDRGHNFTDRQLVVDRGHPDTHHFLTAHPVDSNIGYRRDQRCHRPLRQPDHLSFPRRLHTRPRDGALEPAQAHRAQHAYAGW